MLCDVFINTLCEYVISIVYTISLNNMFEEAYTVCRWMVDILALGSENPPLL
jgi:hypothetical protein